MSAPIARSMKSALEGWAPDPINTADDLAPSHMHALAAVLGTPAELIPEDGDPVPPLWHWAWFSKWEPTARLGPDGHPRDGEFLPPIPCRTRVWAGGRCEQRAPLRSGTPAVRRSSLASVAIKQGRTGELAVVRVRYEIEQAGVVAVVEEQEHIYRFKSATAGGSRRAVATQASETPRLAPTWEHFAEPDPLLLFRFSAVTANSHRIHYDLSYARDEEGYPGLVVHGPLQAMWMAELLRTKTGKGADDFRYRLMRPAFAGTTLHVAGASSDTTDATLWVADGDGVAHAEATARQG